MTNLDYNNYAEREMIARSSGNFRTHTIVDSNALLGNGKTWQTEDMLDIFDDISIIMGIMKSYPVPVENLVNYGLPFFKTAYERSKSTKADEYAFTFENFRVSIEVTEITPQELNEVIVSVKTVKKSTR